MPIVASYLRALRRGLDAAGIPARLLLMQSNGGLTSDVAATERPMNIIESGPAGGVVGAQALARAKHLPKIITFDMGGTTAKASMVEDGEVSRASEYSVGAGIMIGSRLLTGAGYLLKVPAIDLAEVGAGGGSLVWIDGGGSLQIGPESAGAAPGPVCYDKGGETPDRDRRQCRARLHQPRAPGRRRPQAQRREGATCVPRQGSRRRLAWRSTKRPTAAHQIDASNMIRAIKSVVDRARPRSPRIALFAFGGNGPLFACGMARALGMSRVVVPPSAGLFSSFGLLYADVEHHYSRNLPAAVAPSRPRRDRARLDGLAGQAVAQLATEDFHGDRVRLRRSAALALPGAELRADRAGARRRDRRTMLAYLEEAFGPEHEKTYGHRAGPTSPSSWFAIQVVGQGLRQGAGIPDRVRPSRAEPEPPPPRPAYFGADAGA